MDENKVNEIPDIYFEFDETQNPIVSSPNSEFSIQFEQTKESLLEIDTYKNFISNAVAQFRHSRFYKQYKSYLIDLGLNRCQYFPNITVDLFGEGPVTIAGKPFKEYIEEKLLSI